MDFEESTFQLCAVQMASIAAKNYCESDFVPPYLARLISSSSMQRNVLEASLSAQKISSSRTRYTYAVTWEEDIEPARSVSGADLPTEEEEVNIAVESRGHFKVGELDIMTLNQRTDGEWSCPYSFQMIPTRALVFKKFFDGEMKKHEIWGEARADTVVGEIVDDLMDSMPSHSLDRSKTRVFVCPVAKEVPLIRLTNMDLLQKRAKELDLHQGKLCLVFDSANVF